MVARLAAEDAVFVLDGDEADAVDVEKVGWALVGGEVRLRDLEAHPLGLGMAPAGLVHRDDETLELRAGGAEGLAQVGGEGRDAALPRQMIAQDCGPSQLRRGSLWLVELQAPPSRDRA